MSASAILTRPRAELRPEVVAEAAAAVIDEWDVLLADLDHRREAYRARIEAEAHHR